MIYLITRHPGALEWLKQQTTQHCVHMEHLKDLDIIGVGDIVAGSLPVHMIEQICRRGARYFSLQIDLPLELRGKELSAIQLTELNAGLVEYTVLRPSYIESILHWTTE